MVSKALSSPRGPLRLVVRYETGDSLDTDETESDVEENDPNTLVVVVQYVDVPAKSPLSRSDENGCQAARTA